MRKWLGFGLVMALLAAGCCPMCKRMFAPNPNLGRVRHVVLLKFKETTAPAQIRDIEEKFRALGGKIREIRDLEWGTDMSTEKLSEGFTHCFLVTFDNSKARDAYLPDPEHKAFAEALKPLLDKVLVIDYVARK